MKEDLRTQLSKKMLKDALLELLKHKRFYDINVRELCDKAGVNRSTFYRHYDNIADVMNDIIDDIGKIIIDANTSSSNDPDHANNYVYHAVRFFDEHHEYDPLILAEQDSLLTILSRFEDFVLGSFDNIHTGNDAEKRYLVKFLLSGTYAILTDWVIHGRKEPAKQIADIIYQLSYNTVNGH